MPKRLWIIIFCALFMPHCQCGRLNYRRDSIREKFNSWYSLMKSEIYLEAILTPWRVSLIHAQPAVAADFPARLEKDLWHSSSITPASAKPAKAQESSWTSSLVGQTQKQVMSQSRSTSKTEPRKNWTYLDVLRKRGSLPTIQRPGRMSTASSKQ